MDSVSLFGVKSRRSRVPTRYWRFAYGAIFACILAAVLIALVFNIRLITTDTVSKFGFAWAFWSWPTLDIGVIPYMGLWALLTIFERRFPAGTVKPASGWFL